MAVDALAGRAVRALFLCAGLLAACAEGPAPPPEPEPGPSEQDLSCSAQPDPLCDHPVNAIVVPLVRQLGLTPAEAPREEVCRRLHVDLIGRIPTPSELSLCVGQTQAAAVDALMGSADYERLQHSFWARVLRYQVGTVVFRQIFDLDELVGRLVDGDIRYDAFAGEVVMHPGFFGSRLDAGWGPGVFEVFLGRAPRPDEMDGLDPLARMFSARLVCDGQLVDALYRYCQDNPEQFAEPCAKDCTFFNLEAALFECGCTPVEEPFTGGDGPSYGCTGDGLGQTVDLGATQCFDFELSRVIEYTAGQADRCPDAAEPCDDLLATFLPDGSYLEEPAYALPPASDTVMASLHQIGDALSARADFWEAAVDRELTRYLGWWKAGFNQPDFDLPAVRTLLADVLRESGDLRDVQRLVLTSLLYTAPATPVEGVNVAETEEDVSASELPPWSMGPVKLLAGEAWLDSASAVVGEVLGGCDYRFIDPNSEFADIIAFLSEAVVEEASTFDPYSWLLEFNLDQQALEAAYVYLANLTSYRSLARGLGGCRVDPAPRTPSLSLVGQQADTASVLCAFGTAAVPERLDADDRSQATLQRIAAHLWERAFASAPDAEQLDALVGEIELCLDEGSCADAEVASRWMCARLLDSSMFGVY